MENIKKEQIKFANWLNKKGLIPSVFNINKWVTTQRRDKHTKEPIIYTTEELLEEFYIGNGI